MGLKEEYFQKAQAQLNEWSAKIDQLKAKADKADAQAKIDYRKQLDAIRVKQEAAQAKLNQLRAAGEGAWESLKSGADTAWDDLKAAYENAVSHFK